MTSSLAQDLKDLQDELIRLRCEKYNGEIILTRTERVISSDDVRNVPKGAVRYPKYRNVWSSR